MKDRMFTVHEGDSLEVLKGLPDCVYDTAMTSPPYWRKVDYHHPGQLGWEQDPEEYIRKIADIFSQVHRTLKDTGTLWVVIDDTYIKKVQSVK